MAIQSPHRAKALRFSALLLAGASVSALSMVATADPLPPFWVIPSVLSDGATNGQTQASSVLTLYRPALKLRIDALPYLRPGLDLQALPLNSLEFSSPSADNRDGFASTRLVSHSLELPRSAAARVARIGSGLNFSDGASSAQVTSFDTSFANGNLRFGSDVIDSGNSQDSRDFRDPQLRETPRELRSQDISRRHRFATKLIDSGNLKLMVGGEMGQISEEFAHRLVELPTGQMVLPGSWSNMSSRFEYGRTNLTVGYQDYETRNEANRKKQLVVGFLKSELQVYRRQASEFNLINGGQWLKRTTYSGVNADIMLADVMPSTVAEFIDPIRAFLPTSIRGGAERGDIVRSDFSSGPRDKVSTANLAMTWNTRLGDTTASFWERRISTDMLAPGIEEGVRLSRSTDRYVDLSHSIRHGNWKFGAGLSLIQTNDEMLGARSSGSEYAPHVSVGYAPEHGPKIELRFGAADAQSQIVDDNVAARAKTRQLQLSLDVSDYVRDELNRPDAKLKLEYRYDFSNGGDSAGVGTRERDGGHALLVTFSTPLN